MNRFYVNWAGSKTPTVLPSPGLLFSWLKRPRLPGDGLGSCEDGGDFRQLLGGREGGGDVSSCEADTAC